MSTNIAKKLQLVNNNQLALKPLKTRSKRGKEYPQLNYPSEKIDELVSLKEQLADLQVLYKTQLAELHQQFAAQCQMETEALVTTMLAKGKNNQITITRKDQYTKLDFGESDRLGEMLGDELYDELFDERVDAELKVNWFDFAVEAASKGFENISDYFKLTQYLQLGKGAMETRLKARMKMDDITAHHVDEVFKQCQYKPSIRLKKWGA